ncbi:MAG: RagB/SusD family nutrient uptake outer membrane protein [Anditalea sp.]
MEVLIAKERQVEFCFENQRWYDLKRTGKALEVMAAHGIREKEKNRSYTTRPSKWSLTNF